MSPVASGPWERRPHRPTPPDGASPSPDVDRRGEPDEPTRELPLRPQYATPAQVPFFPGQEDATTLIQRITDEAVPTGSTGPSARERTGRSPAPGGNHDPTHRNLLPANGPRQDVPRAAAPPQSRPTPGAPGGAHPLPDAGTVAAATPFGTVAAATPFGTVAAATPFGTVEPVTLVADEPLRTARTGGVVRAGSMMAAATLASRITGFLAKVLLIAALGASIANDSYNLANTLPNIVFELVIGGVLTSVAIPLLSRARSDPDGGAGYTQRLMTMAVVGLLAVTVLAVLAAPLFTRLYISGGANADAEQATALARLLLPQIFFYGMAALFGAILNTKERFAAPALAPLVNNLVVIVVAVVVGATAGGTRGRNGLLTLSPTQLWLLGVGTTAGIVVQALVMLPALRRSGFRFRWRWGGDRRLLEAGGLMLWSIGYALISAIGYVVSTRVFTGNQGGALTAYSFASLLFQLPYGILGVSVLTAIMPRMSRHAAAGDIGAVKDDASLANRLSTVALMPVAVAMLTLSMQLGTVSSNYGKMTAESSRMIGGTLAGLALGLVPLAITLVQMRVFYAMKDARTPTLINAIMVAVRIPLILIAGGLRPDLIAPGIAVATAVSYLIGALVGETWLRFRYGPMGSGRQLLTIVKVGVAAGLAGSAAWYVARLLDDQGIGVRAALVQLLAGAVTGLLVLVPAMLLLRVPEVDPLRRRFASLLGFAAAPPVAGRKAVAAAGHEPDDAAVAPSTQRAPAAAMAFDRQEFSTVASDTPDDLFGEDEATVTSSPAEQPAVRQPSAAEQPPAVRQPPADDTTVTVQPAGDTTVTVQPPRDSRTDRADRRTALAPGVTIGGRYRLVNQVAVDGAGNRFWRAKDTVLPRDMAVTLLPDSSGTSATVARTLRAGRLHHIGLPQTLDLGTEHGHTFVVGQWVDGATLTDLLAGGPLEPGVATSIAGKISEAVAEAHRNGLALGSISPSLVRVNVDGQVRFSHVVAHAAANPDADIRAVGALLYLMLTGTWPASEKVPAVPGAALRSAPQRDGREVPANEIVEQVPAALAALAARALHPEDPNGIHAVGALATLLREPDVTPGTVGGSFGPPPPRETPPPTMSPADRKLRKERRMKLAVASAIIAAFVALILIVAGTLAKNMLVSVSENNISGFDAITQSPSSIVPTTAPPPKTTPPSTSGSSSASQSSRSSAPTSTTAASSAPAGQPVKITGAEVFDPEGQGNKDYADLVDRLYDGDPESEWLTFHYRQQFKAKALGGYKVGVGVVLQFDHPVTPQSVTITVPEPGLPGSNPAAGAMTVEIRTSATALPTDLAQTQLIGSGQVAGGPAVINVQGAPQSRYLLVFLTQIPGSGNDYQAKIGEITVTGG